MCLSNDTVQFHNGLQHFDMPVLEFVWRYLWQDSADLGNYTVESVGMTLQDVGRRYEQTAAIVARRGQDGETCPLNGQGLRGKTVWEITLGSTTQAFEAQAVQASLWWRRYVAPLRLALHAHPLLPPRDPKNNAESAESYANSDQIQALSRPAIRAVPGPGTNTDTASAPSLLDIQFSDEAVATILGIVEQVGGNVEKVLHSLTDPIPPAPVVDFASLSRNLTANPSVYDMLPHMLDPQTRQTLYFLNRMLSALPRAPQHIDDWVVGGPGNAVSSDQVPTLQDYMRVYGEDNTDMPNAGWYR